MSDADASAVASESGLAHAGEVGVSGDAFLALVEHIQVAHGRSFCEYREHILRRTLAEWPQPISLQVLRNRLAAFKDELSDANFRMRVCASCAREKR